MLETDGEDMQNREHSCFFSAAHAAKDSGIALELARNLGLAQGIELLDIGSGTGRFLDAVKQVWPKLPVFALDL